MKPTIPNPKVFVSYARGSQEYNKKVEDFCSELKANGIEVLFDIWSVKPGGDFYSFMESSVNDPSVTNVLVLLNQMYKEKADSRQGGVGTETQILSPEVYNNIDGAKIIPILFERNQEGEACAPTYIKTRNWIDMDDIEKRETNLIYLVRFLFGVKYTQEPELGEMPDWVTEGKKSVLWISDMNKKHKTLSRAKLFFDKIYNDFTQFYDDTKEPELDQRPDLFNSNNKELLVNYIEVLIRLDIDNKFIDDFSEFGENCFNFIENYVTTPLHIESGRYLLNEIAIYTIGWLYKQDLYDVIHRILLKSYFISPKFSRQEKVYNFSHVFYSGTVHPKPIEEFIKAKENKNYYSVSATLWTRRIQSKLLSLEEFISADQLITNITFTLNNYRYPWFPLSYCYGTRKSNVLLKLFEKMKSRYQFNNISRLFGVSSVPEMKALFDIALEKYKEFGNKFRYSMSFDEPYLFFLQLKKEDVTSIN